MSDAPEFNLTSFACAACDTEVMGNGTPVSVTAFLPNPRSGEPIEEEVRLAICSTCAEGWKTQPLFVKAVTRKLEAIARMALAPSNSADKKRVNFSNKGARRHLNESFRGVYRAW